MADVQGIATFPGVDQILRATYTMGHGVAPSVCVLHIAPQEAIFADVGTLTFEYDAESVVLPQCKADMASARLNEDGLVWQVSLLDRRWKWAFGQVWGEYNMRDDGELLLPTFERTPQELAEYLLNNAGESLYDVSQLPNDARPHVEWIGANPMTELERLCHELSCRVVLHLNDSVTIEPLGIGAALPSLPSIMENSLSVDPPNQPDSILVFGDRSMYQTRIQLEAVGKDIDDAILPIDELSYTPAGGWEKEPFFMSNVAEADGARKRALETVFRWYRLKIDADNVLPIVPLGLSIVDRGLILPLLPGLPVWTLDDDQRARQRPAVFGIYYTHAGPSADTSGVPYNSDEFDEFEYKGQFQIDLARGIVKFHRPVVQYNGATDGWLPADLWLECAFHLRSPEIGVHFRWIQELDLPGAPYGTGPQVIDRINDLQVWRRMLPDAPSSGNPAGVTSDWEDNLVGDDIEGRAQYFLEMAALQYTQPEAAGSVTYAGLVPIDLDGAIGQVTYRIDDDGTTTTASRNSEHDPHVPLYRTQREARFGRAANRQYGVALREMRRDVRRRTGDA